MLHNFLVTHKAELIRRCRMEANQISSRENIHLKMDYGIPIFLDQLIDTLRAEHATIDLSEENYSVFSKGENSVESELSASAMQHGRELSNHGVTVDQIVHEYGDLCQAITKLAFELGVSIDVNEFKIFNRCLDDAIASAVTEFSYQKDTLTIKRGAQAVDERLRVLANEQRHHLRTAGFAMKAIRAGDVGLNGATGAILELSLASLQRLLDRFMDGLGWPDELPARQHLILLVDFIDEVKSTSSPETNTGKYKFIVRDVDKELAVVADGDLLFIAVRSLLKNAFKSVLENSEIILSTRAAGERVLIEIASVIGEHSREKSKQSTSLDILFGAVESVGGLDLSVCRRSVEVNRGFLSVRNLPGAGSVFTIDLPRHLPP